MIVLEPKSPCKSIRTTRSHPAVHFPLVWLLVLIALLGSGCQGRKNAQAQIVTDPQTPTITQFIDQAQTPTPSPSSVPTDTPNPGNFPFSIQEATKVAIYSDIINPNWGLVTTQSEETNPRSRTPVYNGLFSLSITPKKSGSQVFFMVQQDTDEVYPASQVHGFRFFLNPGSQSIPLSELSIHILGSQEQVETRDPQELGPVLDGLIFNNAQIHFSNASDAIPPNTWTEVVVWLDDPLTTPQFDYVTGLSIERKEAFLQTFFIDDLQLIVAGSTSLPTPIWPTATAVPPDIPTDTPTLTPSPTRTPISITPTFTPTNTKPPKDTKVPPTQEPQPTEDDETPPPAEP